MRTQPLPEPGSTSTYPSFSSPTTTVSSAFVSVARTFRGQDDLPIEINDDGTLDTPLGELKKKSS